MPIGWHLKPLQNAGPDDDQEGDTWLNNLRSWTVVRDFATGSASALNSGIYAPTSSLDGLRCVLAASVVEDLNLLTAERCIHECSG